MDSGWRGGRIKRSFGLCGPSADVFLDERANPLPALAGAGFHRIRDASVEAVEASGRSGPVVLACGADQTSMRRRIAFSVAWSSCSPCTMYDVIEPYDAVT